MGAPELDTDTPDPASLLGELLSGFWVIAAHREEDGFSYYLAARSDAGATPSRALTDRERDVLTRALLGESNKSIAISLGVGRTSVTTLLARARRKLAHRVPEQVLRALLAQTGGGTGVRIERAPRRHG